MTSGCENKPETAVRSMPTAHGDLTFGGRCLVMGVLNVTPDSFSDGGAFVEPQAAVACARQMEADGADIIDIGGESTRPGSGSVAADEQIRRVMPVIRTLRETGLRLPISIDTQSAAVAEKALDAGADVVNDVSGVRRDPDMPRLLAERRVPFVVMHMKGTPDSMQEAPRYDDVVAEVVSFFRERAERLAAAGVDVDAHMIVDPGLGFGKTTRHNLELLAGIDRLRGRWPLLVGASRKRFIGQVLDEPTPAGRLIGSVAVAAHCALSGVEMIRAHDVRETRQVVTMCDSIRRVDWEMGRE